MKVVDTREYVSVLRNLTEDGHEVNMLISGNSMSPFLIHQRDYIYFSKPDRPLKKGDIVFYERDNGQFVMHRICRVHKSEEHGTTSHGTADSVADHGVASHEAASHGAAIYDIIGDAQTSIEYGIREDQIFARINHVKRKDQDIYPGDFWWEFFEKVWIRVIPLRPALRRGYSFIASVKNIFKK